MVETLCFPDHDTAVLGVPVVDGLTSDLDAGIITNEREIAYGVGSRLTYNGGSTFPPVIFQGVKQAGADFIYLSFFARFDRFFDKEDVVVIVVRPNAATTTHGPDARRIDVFPVYEDFGADEPGAIGGSPAGSADDSPAVPAGAPPSSTYHIRTNHTAQKVDYYQGSASGAPWISTAAPAGIEVKVRSWKPPVPSGQPEECAWSIEVKLPTTTAAGGASWIDLLANFGLYFNVIRVCGEALCAGTSTPFGPFASTQSTWPRDTSINRTITGTLGTSTNIPASWLGSASFGGAGGCVGVGFVDPFSGIGAEVSPGGSLGTDIDASAPVTLAADVKNTDPMNDALGVTAEFRLSNWGLGPGAPAAWSKINAVGNPTSPVTVPKNTASQRISMVWNLTTAERTTYSVHTHQCMWVQLDSAQNVNFIQSGERRNMDLKNLSSFDDTAEISGVGYPTPAGGRHDFTLITNVRRLLVPEITDGIRPILSAVDRRETDPKLRAVWIWILHGFRRTGETLTIGTKTFEVLDDTPGSFGYILIHDGSDQNLDFNLKGAGLTHRGGNVWDLPVPHDGAVTLDLHFQTQVEPPVDTQNIGCLQRILKAIGLAALSAIAVSVLRR
jgi:hypothetical protein